MPYTNVLPHCKWVYSCHIYTMGHMYIQLNTNSVHRVLYGYSHRCVCRATYWCVGVGMMLFVTGVVELVHRAMQGNVFTVSSLGTFMRWRVLLCTLPVFVKGEEMRYVYKRWPHGLECRVLLIIHDLRMACNCERVYTIPAIVFMEAQSTSIYSVWALKAPNRCMNSAYMTSTLAGNRQANVYNVWINVLFF